MICSRFILHMRKRSSTFYKDEALNLIALHTFKNFASICGTLDCLYSIHSSFGAISFSAALHWLGGNVSIEET